MMFAYFIGKTMEIYKDNMLVKSPRVVDHVKHLENSFQILKKNIGRGRITQVCI